MSWFKPLITTKKVKRGQIIDVDPMELRLRHEFGVLLTDVWTQCATYEVAAPDPEVYVRTNTLKKSWSKRGPRKQGNNFVGKVVSSGQTAPYNVYVRGTKNPAEGEGQAEHMAKRGWLSVTTIADQRWPPARAKMARIMQKTVG